MNPILEVVLSLVAVGLIIFGLFFNLVGVLGLVRLPDFYNRMHAATKGMTLGISGLLMASVLLLSMHHRADPFMLITKGLLVMIFQFVANPVGAHLLAKAAHLDGVPTWESTLSDELREDREGGEPPQEEAGR